METNSNKKRWQPGERLHHHHLARLYEVLGYYCRYRGGYICTGNRNVLRILLNHPVFLQALGVILKGFLVPSSRYYN